MSRLRVEPEHRDELIRAFQNRLGKVEAFDGFNDLEVWCSDREPGEV